VLVEKRERIKVIREERERIREKETKRLKKEW